MRCSLTGLGHVPPVAVEELLVEDGAVGAEEGDRVEVEVSVLQWDQDVQDVQDVQDGYFRGPGGRRGRLGSPAQDQHSSLP